MKKLRLNLQQLNAEVLTRSQLKQILGGYGGSGETCNCNSKADCSSDKPCCVSGCTKGSSGDAGVCHSECA